MRLPLHDVVMLADSGVWGDEDPTNGVSVLRSTNFNADGTLDLSKLTYRAIEDNKRERKLLREGDILLEKSGGGPQQPVGRVCLFKGDTKAHSFGNFIARLRPAENITSEYLFYWLWHFHATGKTNHYQKQTTGIRNLELKRYLAVEIPVPLLGEQRRIVDILSRAEGIVRLRHEAQKKSQEIIPALFLDMFGDPATNPKGWRVTTVGEIASYTRYGPRFADRRYADQGAHIMRTTDIDYDGGLRWYEAPILPMSEEELAKYSLHANTLLITRTGATIGKTALFRGASRPCIAGAYLIELGLSDAVMPDFALHFFLSPFGQSRLIGGSRAVAQPNLNAPTIREIRIPLPDLKLQRQFANTLANVSSIQSQQAAATTKAEATFNALLAQMFSQEGQSTTVTSKDSVAIS